MQFSKNIIKQFHNLVEVPTTLTNRVRILQGIEDIFDVDNYSKSHGISFMVSL
jgi:hypothetical protein